MTAASLALALGASAPATAQTTDEFQLWAALLATGSFQRSTPRFAYWLDVHGRRGADGTVVIVRPGVGLEVNAWLSLWAGYAWVPVFTDGAGSVSEHRLWQQAVLQHAFASGVSVQARTRFEQRFSEAGDDVGFRIRQFVRVNWQPDAAVPLGVALWDEVFVGLNDVDWGPRAGFDQNRLFVGPFLALSPWARLEAGYLFVYLAREPANRIAHTLAINLFVSARL